MADEMGVVGGASQTESYQWPGLKSITPCLVVGNAVGLLDFLTAAFGGVERVRVPAADGSVKHAEVTIGNGAVELGEASADYPGVTAAVHLYVEDADATFARAIEAGATSVSEVEDQ